MKTVKAIKAVKAVITEVIIAKAKNRVNTQQFIRRLIGYHHK